MRLFIGVVIISAMMTGCALNQVHQGPEASATRPPRQVTAERKAAQQPAATDYGWTTKVITDQELLQIYRKDLTLTPEICREILAKLNARAPYHISADIQSQRPLKVPNDFAVYKGWSPLPPNAPAVESFAKSIVIVKEHPYIGWYERGHLKGESYACVGRPGEVTEAGLYRVLEKDPDHVSRSYRNSYGEPAWMPWALRIYDHVWIHAGDVTGAYCSHGCIILPLDPAQDVYRWADLGTVVQVVDSLKDLSAQPHRKFLE